MSGQAYGPSPAAVKAAMDVPRQDGQSPLLIQQLRAAHDPALGDAASVNRGAFVQEIVAYMRSFGSAEVHAIADHVEARFTGQGNGR